MAIKFKVRSLADLRNAHQPRPTQADIAKELNVARATYGRKESGDIPVSIEELEVLSRYYGVGTSAFFEDDSKEKKAEKREMDAGSVYLLLLRLQKRCDTDRERLQKQIDLLQDKVDFLMSTEAPPS